MRYSAGLRKNGSKRWDSYFYAFDTGRTLTLRGMQKRLDTYDYRNQYQWRVRDNLTGKYYYHI